MNEYRIRRARLVAGEMSVPGDFAISLRALAVAALANGPSVLRGFLPAVECMDFVQSLQSLGVRFDYLSIADIDQPWNPPPDGSGPPGPSCIRVHGLSGKFKAPSNPVTAGSGRSAPLLLLALLSGQTFVSRMVVPELSGRATPVAAALKTMGAAFAKQASWVECGALSGLTGTAIKTAFHDFTQRDAVLLAGLFAAGKTTLTDASPGPDHLEQVLRHFQVKTLRDKLQTSIWGGQMPESCDLEIPGDISCAAPFIMAAAVQPGSVLTVRNAGLSPARTVFLRVLVRMGAQIREEIRQAGGHGLCVGSVVVRGAPLRGTSISASEADALGDELPALLVAAAQASGDTVIKFSSGGKDRTAPVLDLAARAGVEVVPKADGAVIRGTGGEPFDHAEHDSGGDPALAAAAALAGLCGDGDTVVRNAGCLEARWPGFHRQLERFQSREISEGVITPMLHIVGRQGKRGGQRPRSGPSGSGEKRS